MAPGISFLWGRATPSAWVILPSLTLLLTHKLLAPIWPQRDISNPPGPFPPLLKPSVAPHHPRRNPCTSALHRRPRYPIPHCSLAAPHSHPAFDLVNPGALMSPAGLGGKSHPDSSHPSRTPSCTLTYKYTYSHMHSHTYTPYLLTHTCTQAVTHSSAPNHTRTHT